MQFTCNLYAVEMLYANYNTTHTFNRSAAKSQKPHETKAKKNNKNQKPKAKSQAKPKPKAKSQMGMQIGSKLQQIACKSEILGPKCSKYKPEARNRRSQKPKARSQKPKARSQQKKMQKKNTPPKSNPKHLQTYSKSRYFQFPRTGGSITGKIKGSHLQQIQGHADDLSESHSPKQGVTWPYLQSLGEFQQPKQGDVTCIQLVVLCYKLQTWGSIWFNHSIDVPWNPDTTDSPWWWDSSAYWMWSIQSPIRLQRSWRGWEMPQLGATSWQGKAPKLSRGSKGILQPSGTKPS